MESCRIKPDQIPNRDGVLEDPILFEDLMKATGKNYQISSLIYNMIDDEFLDKYGGKLKYDRQGMPTLSSLLKIPAVALNFKIGDNEVLANLSKQFKTGIYSYEDAIEKVGAFNRNPSFNSDYFASISEITEGPNKGKFKFEIVKNTASAQRALQDFITQRTFRERLLYALAQTGVKVDFLEDMMAQAAGIKGIYTTKQPEKVYDTLYNVIRIIKGEKNNLDILKEETGHLIIGIAGNNADTKTLYTRLIESLKVADKNSIKQILIEEGNYTDAEADNIIADVENDENALREIAGRIVATELDKHKPIGIAVNDNNKVKRVSNSIVNGIKRLKSRLWNITKGILMQTWKALGQISNSTLGTHFDTSTSYFNVEQAVNKDRIIQEARQLAAKFMNNTLGDVSDAFGTSEERHHESLEEARVAARLVNSFNSFIKLLQNTGLAPKEARKLHGEVENAVRSKDIFMHTAKKALKNNPNSSINIEGFAIRANYNMISTMLDSIQNIVTEMKEGQWQEVLAGNFKQRLVNGEIAAIPDLNEKVKGISQLLNLIRLCNETDSFMNDLLGTNSEFALNFHIAEKQKAIRDMMVEVNQSIAVLNRELFSASLATVNGGKNYIQRSRRMGFKGVIDSDKPIYFDELFAGVDGEGHAVVEDAGIWGVYMQKMGSSISTINQLAANLYDFNKAEANKDMYRYSQILLDFHERVKKLLGDEDTGFICEMDENGVATGNIVQPNFNYGKWEKDYADWKKETYKRLKEEHADELEGLDQFQRGEKLFEWFKPEYEQWHQEHSKPRPDDYINELFEDSPFEEDAATIKYIPNGDFEGGKYRSNQWDRLSETQKELVKEYVKIKQSLDQFINEYHPDSITSWRLPQFRATTIARMRNKDYIEIKNPDGSVKNRKVARNGIMRTAHDKFIENFFEDALDEEFGDNSTYNNEDDSFFDMASLNDKELSRRIPVYGINKLSDMRNISRDVVYSTMQYAAMALNVRGMSTTSMILQNGVEVINETTVNGIREKSRQGTHSGIYDRYIKFLEMQVFGQRSSKIPLFTTSNGHKFILNKLSSYISRTSSWWLLAGKLASGTVNTGTGINQIIKEGFAGEHYNGRELSAAVREYMKYAVEADFKEGLAPLNRSNKMYSFIRYFDVLNNNDTYFRDFTSHQQLSGWSQLRKLNYAMWVYESGNHFMQSIPYIAKSMHTKLYTLNEGVDETPENLQNANNFNKAGSIWDLFDEAQLQRGKNVQKFQKKREKETGEDYLIEQPTIINDQEAETGMWGNPFQDDYYVQNPDGSFVKWDRTAQSRFQTQCRYVTDNMHGIYNSADAVALNQDWLGASILTMKKYMLGYVDKFTLTDRYSVADGKDIEGNVITWMKMMNFYARNPGMKARIASMGIPILLSFAAQNVGSQVLSTVFGLGYFLTSPIGLSKSTQNRMLMDGFSQHQIYNLKRFDMEMKVSLVLRTIANLLSNGLYAHGDNEDDDDDDTKKKSKKKKKQVILNLGEEIDAWLLKKLGYETYEEDLKEALSTEKGTAKQNAKTPGILYTAVSGMKDKKNDHTKENWLYNMGIIYYFTHRWQLEQSTLFPFDLNRNMFSEIQAQAGANFNLYPVGYSQTGYVAKAVGNLTQKGAPNYKYDKEAETFKDLYDNYGKWDETGIPKWIKAIRTGEHIIVGDNKGAQQFINMIPYLNSLGLFEDPYKAATSYDFGRTMTAH